MPVARFCWVRGLFPDLTRLTIINSKNAPISQASKSVSPGALPNLFKGATSSNLSTSLRSFLCRELRPHLLSVGRCRFFFTATAPPLAWLLSKQLVAMHPPNARVGAYYTSHKLVVTSQPRYVHSTTPSANMDDTVWVSVICH